MPQHTITLESPWKRIKLVPPSSKNDELYAYCRTHPITRRYLGMIPKTMTVDDARIFREKRAEEADRVDLHIEFTEEGGNTVFAGFGGYFHIDNDNLSCEGGIIVHPDLHGKNIATETFYVLLKQVFEEMKFHRFTFMTRADNEGMTGWLEQVAGMKAEGVMREVWKELNGNFVDAKLYAILEQDWRDGVKKKLEGRLNYALERRQDI